MSFDVLERSNYDGQPLALYEFNVGTKFWRYCSHTEDVPFGGQIFTGIPISDDGSRQSGEANTDELKITMPSDTDFARLFVGTPPSEEIWIAIRQLHHGDNDAPIQWIGTVGGTKLTGLRKAETTCQMLSASFDRNGLRLSWGRQCPLALYDRNCRVNKNAFVTTLQVEGVSGRDVVSAAIASLPAGWLSNGFFEWTTPKGLIDRRPIEMHAGNRFSVLGTTDGLTAGQWINVYPGCNRTTDNCQNKFNNLSNYGGFPHLPGKSPFDGSTIF